MGSDDDDAAMAASQVIEAVSTVLQSTKSVPELFPAMEAHLLPMLVKVRCVSCLAFLLWTLLMVHVHPSVSHPDPQDRASSSKIITEVFVELRRRGGGGGL